MTIINLMLGKKRGGLEQAAVDYAEAMALGNIPSLTVTTPTAWIEAPLAAAGLAHEGLVNMGGWDPFAVMRLRRLVKRVGARAIICHGNRALKLALKACKGTVPIIAVAHNHAISRFGQADHCFAITHHIKQHLAAQTQGRLSLVPNMVRLPGAITRPAFRTPPVIGSLGRFVDKKGYDILIEALAIIKNSNVDFRAIIGGDGDQLPTLKALIAQHGLEDRVSLPGWIADKREFFHSIDIFALPSRMEAFGIVLIEAMAYGVPIVTSDADGPRSITHHGVDALVTPRGDAGAMAHALIALLDHPAHAAALAAEAKTLVEREYTIQAMATRLNEALAPYMEGYDG